MHAEQPQHDSQALITVASCISALELEPENDTFVVRVSQRIRCIPGVAPVSVRATMGLTKITGDPSMHPLPCGLYRSSHGRQTLCHL
jgi:hypothetical protein